MNRSIRRLYLTLAAGFGLLMLMLGWWQVVAADDLRDRTGNLQTQQQERLIDRGRILSADGKALARSRPRRVQGQQVYERRYPQGALAAHVVGYTSDERGKTGVEDFYNRYLSGSFGTEPLLQRLNLREKRGADVQLSIDTRVQGVAEEHLAGRRGAVVALDPSTGQVLAMASAPTFNLQTAITDFPSIPTEGGPFLNRATAGAYAPGSTFKVVTATAALESGRFTAGSTFRDTGRYSTPGGDIRNFGGNVFGTHTLTTALTNSINTTFASIGDDLGAARLGETMEAYGFGERPPIDLPDDQVRSSGRRGPGDRLLPNDEQGIDVARVAIGQERLLVTPLQMAMVAAGVANGGTVMAPQLMRRILDRGGSEVRRATPRPVGEAMDAATAAELAAMMENVVREGTGTAAALSSAGVTVAGKTGTAESDDPNRNQAWFIGFAPAEDPVVAVAVVIEDTSETGGIAAAPVAADVMRAAIEAR
ncbi:peptidoglycan D,D-transpeptidase FtsI family protein [Miltoncostaea marina]|uniref:peptidoglycan D,D-transpeptidase FtsI family protein n=1 Tax=Miltoncostaea marina TaxID=2843215 RepID=UPI001C3CC510|nr:penicillin-binding protein 2 [Miltoncostaea marina]